MNTYRKMVLISADDYNKYKSIMYSSQVLPTINPMQKGLESIREMYGVNLPEDQRNKLESEIIQKYSKKADVSKPKEIDSSKLEWIKNSFKDFAKVNKTRANQLYNILSNRFENRWNENGELLTADGEALNGSNILDLVDYVTSTQRFRKEPLGFNDFKVLMKQANVPSYVFSKRGLDSFNKQESIPSLDFDEYSPKTIKKGPSVSFTPYSVGKRKIHWQKLSK